ncbi:leucyl aminopeptidase family protein [Sphingomonas sinipercae]|uniref:Leucyl aminopeptidase family protein n=1 Tax=Sphingomonas sinipercae TaxID=2714944 RepID=A0A6G7ZMR7_9SPHN|nr:leucyl aminopeptidase family protein [Sphingomonas sinipercae]QIL02287.1 leucyl aminopeptidase family protein [Sphingomonas sinipercae]
MTDFASLLVADRGKAARLVHVVDAAGFDAWLNGRPAADRALLAAHRFDAKSPDAVAILPRGDDFEAVVAVKDSAALSTWSLAKLPSVLPEGSYRLSGAAVGKAALGWLLAQHRFDSYREADAKDAGPRVLVTAEASAIEPAIRLAEATALVRDLVNTPARDLGPAELERAARETLGGFEVTVTSGRDLASGFPLIAAVGAAASTDRAPRLIEASWGDPANPRIAIVGKGVCFDSGGLDLKPASGMRLMKKDMGGAAHALALARLIAAEGLPVRLHLLIPAVENAVSGDALRPGDVVRSRKGLHVEIDNTDAEGRLILADALTKAVEGEPELIVDFATLTGAARVALGPELPALFANDDGLSAAIEQAGSDNDDPAWRMPLWDGYDEMLKSDVADIVNSANSSMAGAIVAAIFMKRFVPPTIRWAHFDTFAWRDSAKPGRPKGGEALGLRAAFAALQSLYRRT